MAEAEKTDCRITLPYSAFIPQNYIRDSAQRIEIYKKISHIENETDMDDVADELLDRFGNLPPAVENLLEIAHIRALGCGNSITKIEGERDAIRIYVTSFDFALWSDLSAKMNGRLKLSLGTSPYVILQVKGGENGVLLLKKLLTLLDKERIKAAKAENTEKAEQ